MTANLDNRAQVPCTNALPSSVYLLVRPSLLLTEAQADFLTWPEIMSCIDLKLYVNGQQIPLLFTASRLTPNQMVVTMLPKGVRCGLHLPISVDVASAHLRLDWSLDFGRYGPLAGLDSIAISHNQQVHIETASADLERSLVFSTDGDNAFDPCNLVSADPNHMKKRCALFGAEFDALDQHYLVSESVLATPISNPFQATA